MATNQKSGYNFNSVDLLIYIWNKRVVLLVVGFLAGITSIAVSLMITPMYEANVIMFPAQNTNVSKELLVNRWSGDNVYGFGEEEEAEQFLQVLNSEPIRTRIIDKYNLMEHYEIDPEGKYPRTELYEQYRSNINFRLTEFMSVEISVMDKDPELAAQIANNISDLVDTVYNKMKKVRTIEAMQLVENEFRESEMKLNELRDSLNMISNQLTGQIRGQSGEDLLVEMVNALADDWATYVSLYTLVRNEASLVTNLRLRYKETRLEYEQNLPHKFVVEEAFPPEKKAYPKKSLIVIVSTFSALLLALIVLIVIDNIRSRIATLKEEE